MDRLRARDERAYASVRAICADEYVADGGSPFANVSWCSPSPRGRTEERAWPHLIVSWGIASSTTLRKGERSISRQSVCGVSIGVLGGGAEDALVIAIHVAVAFWQRVFLQLLLEAVIAERALPGVVPKVEGAAEVAARGEAGLPLVERRRCSAIVERDEEGEATWAR